MSGKSPAEREGPALPRCRPDLLPALFNTRRISQHALGSSDLYGRIISHGLR